MQAKAKYPVSYLTMMLFSCTSLLDTGKFDDLTMSEIKSHMRAKDLIPFLSQLAKSRDEDFDGEFFQATPDFTAWFVDEVEDICVAQDGRERRKYGVESRGLCLVIAYTAELIQRGNQIRLAATA